MAYFNQFPKTLYTFGNQFESTVFTDISIFTEIIDEVKNTATVYQEYNVIDNMRPDQVSYELYNSPDFYWTFFLLNDNIREQGWPLDDIQLLEKIIKLFPNTTIRTNTHIAESTDFVPGKQITGLSSNTTGTILYRNLNLGQVVVEGTKTFTNGETVIAKDNPSSQFILSSSSAEHLAARHYTTVNGTQKNLIDGTTGFVSNPGAQDTEVTQFDFLNAENNKLKEIKVFKRNVVGQISSAFKKALRA
tara:strand:+ start:1000 stop:1740 length:741 start_codon:yes stop_codon:yes gene_type:complete